MSSGPFCIQKIGEPCSGSLIADIRGLRIDYEPADGGQVTVRLEGDSLWVTQEQMAELFGRERSVISKHLRNVFREEELEESSVCANFARTAGDGKTYQTQHYNLDAIISVGYRVNSKRGTQFRQWARIGRDRQPLYASLLTAATLRRRTANRSQRDGGRCDAAAWRRKAFHR